MCKGKATGRREMGKQARTVFLGKGLMTRWKLMSKMENKTKLMIIGFGRRKVL